MIDHLMYKNFLKNTTSIVINEQKSTKFEKQSSHWLYIFIKEKQSTQWNAWQQHLHMMREGCECVWGVSGPVVRALDSGSDGPGSSPGWGTTLWP